LKTCGLANKIRVTLTTPKFLKSQRHPKMSKLSKRATLLKEYETIEASHAVKAYMRFCFADEDSLEGEIDHCISAELAVWVCNAILKHHNQVIKCLNEEERRNNSEEFGKVHDFINCIGVIDGTLLSFKSRGVNLNRFIVVFSIWLSVISI